MDYKYHKLFIIGKFISLHAYNLELPSIFHNIHDILHISLLELYQKIKGLAPSSPLLINSEDEEPTKVEEILNSRVYYGNLQYL